MAEEKKVLTLDEFEQRLMVSGLMDFRNDLLKDDKPTEDINDLILKVIEVKAVLYEVLRCSTVVTAKTANSAKTNTQTCNVT